MDSKHIQVKGINVCNPVDIKKDYLLYTVEYAAKNGFNHIQINGPIHDSVKGNIDGMTLYQKYSAFNSDKDNEYIEKTQDAIGEACILAHKHGIKVYVWHHELELPVGFSTLYPEIYNEYGDVEVTHPLIKDFIQNKYTDFFNSYPGVDGVVLTLHETRIPLLKLKNQKLGKIERVKYVTQIVYDICKAHDKELIVRPFASLLEDYEMMTSAYEEVSSDMPIMDKWTQFDWSLTMGHNEFFSKIKKNPLIVETDIFGEYFGKGRLPLMLKNHLKEKFDYCKNFSPLGYVNRIDRSGNDFFEDVNEVNCAITAAYLNGDDAGRAAQKFFKSKYPGAYGEVEALMEQTEEIQKKIFYINGYYFNELSLFPSLNHCKNHYYFEMMRKDYNIDSNEWYIPKNWKRGNIEDVINEKRIARQMAKAAFNKLEELESRISPVEYKKLWIKFANLKFVSEIWCELTLSIINYVKYFEDYNEESERSLMQNLNNLLLLRKEGMEILGEKFYCTSGNCSTFDDRIFSFVEDMKQSFKLEKKMTHAHINNDRLMDFVICGGAMEGHNLQKEVNFSDSIISNDSICRIPGNIKGMKWSTINAHGWFSYCLNIKPNAENKIKVYMSTTADLLSSRVTIGDCEYVISQKNEGVTELEFTYNEEDGNDSVRIRFDKLSGHVPMIYAIEVFA